MDTREMKEIEAAVEGILLQRLSRQRPALPR